MEDCEKQQVALCQSGCVTPDQHAQVTCTVAWGMEQGEGVLGYLAHLRQHGQHVRALQQRVGGCAVPVYEMRMMGCEEPIVQWGARKQTLKKW